MQPQYIIQTLTDIKEEIDNNTIIVGEINTPLTPMDRSLKQKISKETQVLKDTLNETDLVDIFRTFHPNAEEYTFFSSTRGSFSTSWVTNQTSINLRKLKSYQDHILYDFIHMKESDTETNSRLVVSLGLG